MVKNNSNLRNLVITVALIGIVIFVFWLFNTGRPQEVSTQELIDKAIAGELDRIHIESGRVVYLLSEDSNVNNPDRNFPSRHDGFAYTGGAFDYSFWDDLSAQFIQQRITIALEEALNRRVINHPDIVDFLADPANDGKSHTDYPNYAQISAEIRERWADMYTTMFTVSATAEWQEFAAETIWFFNPNAGAIWSFIFPILIFAIVIGVFIFMFRQNQGSNSRAMNFGKTKARVIKEVKTRFSDVAGCDEEKDEIREVVDFLKHPKKFTELGARIPKGVLLVGEPGTGKTLFAKAVAGEAKVPFFSISGSDFVEMFVGVGASRVRDLFEQAKMNKPCIIFIDEIDAVGRQRGAGLGGGHDEREQTLNQLLVHMDGFESNEGIILMAATNRVDILDTALLRPGRFDRQIYINTPDVRGREAILKVHGRNKKFTSDVNFTHIARLTSGFTGADLENLLNEAAILTARAGRNATNMADINEAWNKVTAGPQKKSRLVTDFDKRITAYHEAGHAVVALSMPNHDAVHEVSIIPRGQMAGYMLTRPETDDSHVTKNKLINQIKILLAGRASEAIILEDISAGASSDIKRASAIARKMVAELGMSDTLGNVYFGSDSEVFLGRDYQSTKGYSENIASIIDDEVKKIIEKCSDAAREIITNKLSIVENMVRLLYKRETIFSAEINLLMEGKSVDEVYEFALEEEKRKEIERQRIEEERRQQEELKRREDALKKM